MTTAPLPTVFVSHGAPTLAMGSSDARNFLSGLGDTLGQPRAILCISAHWETATPMVSAAPAPETIHDFYGFPRALYEISYPAPGAEALAERAAALLAATGLECGIDTERGLDHGAWVPLMLMYPAADVPVIQLSVLPATSADTHIAMGRALAALRHDGVLVLASGSAVHNLRHFVPDGKDVPDWAISFDDWLTEAVETSSAERIGGYLAEHPDALTAHPTAEHFLPLPVAFGAAGEEPKGRVLYRGFMDGALSMAAFAFD